jgi:hypothetical protein
MRYRFGHETDFHTNPEYRKFITCCHFLWKCPTCGVTRNEYHVEGCPVERTDTDDLTYKLEEDMVHKENEGGGE